MKKNIIIILIFCVVLLISCKEITHHNIPDPAENIPVITNVEDSYTYTINAEAFSDSVSSNLNFNADESVITYTVIDYSAGSVGVKVENNVSLPIYEDLIENNVVLVDNLYEKPCRIELVLENFTGMLELVLARED